jgi:hypothetical protein
MKKFYLASDDYGSSDPRECHFVRFVEGTIRDEQYLLVEVNPPLPGSLLERKEEIRDVILALKQPSQTLDDVGRSNVFVDIVVSPHDIGYKIDEREVRRIGVGALHSTLAKARADSPIDDG